MKSAFLLSKGLLCLYDKQNNTWLLVDIEFLFSCSTRHLTYSLYSLVSYKVNTRREILYLHAPMYYSLFICFFTATHSACIFHVLSISTHPSSKFHEKSGKYSVTFLSEAMEQWENL